MSVGSDRLKKVAQGAISGKGSHVETRRVFSGMSWRLAGERPAGVPHSLFQLLNHMIYWQAWVLRWLGGRTPPVPKHAAGSWPGAIGPASRVRWEQAVRRFRAGVTKLERHARGGDLESRRGGKSRLEMLQIIGAHNSYHAGQAAILRQMLGKWPPPGGGVTW